jgi:hypothetical protein
MLAREDGKFLGRFRGSVITRYRWKRPTTIDVTLEHGVPEGLHAWFEIDAVEGGTRIRHVEEASAPGHGRAVGHVAPEGHPMGDARVASP